MRNVSSSLLRCLGALYGGGALIGLPDGKLLERFVAINREKDRTEAELAFATLMQRHGPMVWHVCRSLVFDDHDAEDAFQASFLVLVQKARSLTSCETLGPWLYAVAYRTGLNALRRFKPTQSYRARGGSEGFGRSKRAPRDQFTENGELGSFVNQEIMRLPERFRAAVVLCDIEGLSYQQAAIQLRVPLGTVQSRLSRARLRLRDRLAQKGFRPEDLDGCVMPANAILANVVRASPSPALQQACDRLCAMMVADKVRLHPLVTSSVQNLTTRATKVNVALEVERNCSFFGDGHDPLWWPSLGQPLTGPAAARHGRK